jgi:hypothetical protein
MDTTDLSRLRFSGAVPEPQWVQDVARIDVILDGELRNLEGGIVPRR